MHESVGGARAQPPDPVARGAGDRRRRARASAGLSEWPPRRSTRSRPAAKPAHGSSQGTCPTSARSSAMARGGRGPEPRGSRPSCSACSRSRDGSCAAVHSARGRRGLIAGLRTETWLDAPLSRVAHADACVDLLSRWLRAFGPATATDIRWWTGWTLDSRRRRSKPSERRKSSSTMAVGMCCPTI